MLIEKNYDLQEIAREFKSLAELKRKSGDNASYKKYIGMHYSVRSAIIDFNSLKLNLTVLDNLDYA